MAIHNPPQYRYSLFDDWDKEVFALIKERAQSKNYPEIFRLKNVIGTSALNKKYPPESIGKDVPARVTYEEDRIVSNFIDQLADKKVNFEGTDEEMAEFVLRFILGQLGNDWEQTIIMIWEMLGEEKTLSFKELNNELKNFDYLGIFNASFTVVIARSERRGNLS